MAKKDTTPPVENTGTEVIESGFCAMSDINLSKMMTEEFAGLDLTFDRIKIPAGGATIFEVPSDDPDEPEAVREFSAVILYQHPLLVYYKDAYSGGNAPPDCSSFDAEMGEGDPGGACDKCPLNEFGTAENGGKACKARRRLYLLREGEIFPIILSLPTLSLKPFTRYLMRLFSKGGREPNSVVTAFSLKAAKNKEGKPYSQAQFNVDRALTPEERKVISALSDQVRELSRGVGVNNAEVTDTDAKAVNNGETESDEIPSF